MTVKPVVVYGASGYTGRLICEYLRELNVAFIAAGRDKDRLQDIMSRVPGIETADYEVAEVAHEAGALTELFRGARVVCNTVGPFITLGDPVAEAALAAGCHYLDTTGEQDWLLHAKREWSRAYADAGLLMSPGVAQMYTTGEIAAATTMMVEAEIKTMPAEQQGAALAAIAEQWQAGMPPRENPRLNISVDSVYASGPLGRAHCVIHGNSNYKQTGLLHAWAAQYLVQQAPRRVGLASACQAFGHRELLGVLRAFGLVLEPVLTVSR